MQEKAWQTYEQVATYLLNELASEFGLTKVEGKQSVAGQSGASWEIDAKGIKSNNEGFFIIEARRYTTGRLNQEALGGIAFRIIDTGATGGIVVSPLGLQEGAKTVASSRNIISVQLEANSSVSEYLMRFLDRVMLGTTDSIQTSAPGILSGTLTKER